MTHTHDDARADVAMLDAADIREAAIAHSARLALYSQINRTTTPKENTP